LDRRRLLLARRRGPQAPALTTPQNHSQPKSHE
jgi:hypothetical protein